jgi:aspartate/methionine/tyrosine aminotransferase
MDDLRHEFAGGGAAADGDAAELEMGAAGEPDFDTPDNIKDAAIAAIRRGESSPQCISFLLDWLASPLFESLCSQ